MSSRHLVTGATLIVLCGVVVFGAVWGWRSLFAEVPGSTTDDPAACTPVTIKKGQLVRSRQVQVSVFNAGNVPGLADNTLEALVERGFNAGETGNAPATLRVARVQVWTTVRATPDARLVALQFGRKTRVRVVDTLLGPGINVVVGSEFNGVAKAPRRIRSNQRLEICVPAATPTTTTNASDPLGYSVSGPSH